jgi:hypothetical protein
MKPYSWKQEQARLWEALVPANGQAATMQGEIIRIVGKLTDQAFRNGNLNWDAEHEKMWRFAGRCLDDQATFSEEDRALIKEKIEEIIRDNDTPDLRGDGCCYYIIGEKAVDWCLAHPVPIPHQQDATLKR